MSLLKRAVIKAYDAAAHTASVQIAGSLSVWLTDVPVATDIPPAEVVAGRACTVLLYDPLNPNEAVILAVHGAAPAPAAGGNRIADADGDTEWHTEVTPNKNTLEGKVAGVLRALIQAVSPHHRLTGDTHITANAGVGTAPTAKTRLRIHTDGDGATGAIFDVGGISGELASGTIIGVGGRAIKTADNPVTLTIGLDYLAGSAGQNLTTAIGVRAQIIMTSGSGKTLTDAIAFLARAPINIQGTWQNVYGYRVEAISTGAKRYPFFDAGTTESGDDRANVFKTSTQLFSTTVSLGGGRGVLGIANASVVPSTNPTGGGVLYAEGGALKWLGPNGTVTTIAPA